MLNFPPGENKFHNFNLLIFKLNYFLLVFISIIYLLYTTLKKERNKHFCENDINKNDVEGNLTVDGDTTEWCCFIVLRCCSV